MNEPDKKLLKELNVTVMAKTAEALERMAHASALSIGEVIDRNTLHFHPTKRDMALTILIEEIAIVIAGLCEEDQKATIKELTIHLLVTAMLSQKELHQKELQDISAKAEAQYKEFLDEQSKEQNK